MTPTLSNKSSFEQYVAKSSCLRFQSLISLILLSKSHMQQKKPINARIMRASEEIDPEVAVL